MGNFKENHHAYDHPIRKPKVSDYINAEFREFSDAINGFVSNGVGSNSWVISGAHTKSGKPILCNDPHLKNSLPSIWHFSHIEYPDGSFIAGGAVPGMAGYGTLVTDKIALGLTSVYMDDADLYEEKIQDDTYEYKGQFLPLKIRNEIIKVRGGVDRTIQVKSTHHGPLINRNMEALREIVPNLSELFPTGDYSLKWAGFEGEIDNTINLNYKIVRSQDANEALGYFKQLQGFAQNIIIADVLGNIAFTPTGITPKRHNPKTGFRIQEGWTGENEWDGYLTEDEKPHLINPSKGYIVAANGPVSSQNITLPFKMYTMNSPRQIRISQLVSELIATKSGEIEYEDMIKILSDTVDITMRYKKQKLIPLVRKYLILNPIINKDQMHITMNKLEKWQDNFDKDLEEPSYM